MPLKHYLASTNNSAEGNLYSSNYATARASCLVKCAISGHHSGEEYCDEQLNTAVPQLVKKSTTLSQRSNIIS